MEVDMAKRGQAAMEFLMTYGWAILAAVIVVGVLWYIIGSPANLAGNSFKISQPFVSKGIGEVTTTGLSINLLNGAGESVTIREIDFEDTSCTDSTGLSTTVADGAEQSFDITCSLTTGDRLNSDITIVFSQGSSTFNQTATGSVSATVE
jgi:hypothetical protein